MLEGIKALLHSEKAIAAGFLAMAATVLVVTGHMTIDQWTSYTEVVLVTYVGGKTVQGAVAALSAKKQEAGTAPAAEAPHA